MTWHHRLLIRIEMLFMFFGIPDWTPMPDDDDKKGKVEEADVEGTKAMAYHYQAVFSVNARNKLLDVLRASDLGHAQKRRLLDALELAERVPGTLKERMDWDKAGAEMSKWDSSLKDFLRGTK